MGWTAPRQLAAIRLALSFASSQSPLVATANLHGYQPRTLRAAYGAPTMSYDLALSAGVRSPGPATRQFDYTSAIDPA
jgi:hypothetical protein